MFGMSVAHRGTAVVGVAAWLRGMLPPVSVWRERRRYRRALARMDAHLWADIGLDAATVRAEVAKPFWEA